MTGTIGEQTPPCPGAVSVGTRTGRTQERRNVAIVEASLLEGSEVVLLDKKAKGARHHRDRATGGAAHLPRDTTIEAQQSARPGRVHALSTVIGLRHTLPFHVHVVTLVGPPQ